MARSVCWLSKGVLGRVLGFSNPNEGVAHNPDCIHLWNRGDLRIPAYGSVGIEFFLPFRQPIGLFLHFYH